MREGAARALACHIGAQSQWVRTPVKEAEEAMKSFRGQAAMRAKDAVTSCLSAPFDCAHRMHCSRGQGGGGHA